MEKPTHTPPKIQIFQFRTTSPTMHVCHISTVHPPDDTRIFTKECQGLSNKGISVDLVIQGIDRGIINGVNLIPLKKRSGRFSRMTLGSFEAYRKAKKRKADIYHFHDPELLPVGLFLRLRGQRVVYDMHENVPAQILNKKWIFRPFRRLLSGLFQILERTVLRFFSVVMAEHSYGEAYQWLPHKTTILNLPDLGKLAAFTQRPKREQPTLAYIGGVTNNRGIGTTIDAIERLRVKHSYLRFLCIGPVSQEIQNNAKFSQGVNEGWIQSPGRKPPESGWPLIAECHIGLAILKRTGNYEHSYPTKLFEYMAMGLPVITSDFPLYRDIVDKHRCGISVDPDSLGEITDAIEYLLDNPEEASKMGERGRNAAENHYTWVAELDKLEAFYSEVLAHQQRG